MKSNRLQKGFPADRIGSGRGITINVWPGKKPPHPGPLPWGEGERRVCARTVPPPSARGRKASPCAGGSLSLRERVRVRVKAWPLTPALSPGERGKAGLSADGTPSLREREKGESERGLSPLPQGEG